MDEKAKTKLAALTARKQRADDARASREVEKARADQEADRKRRQTDARWSEAVAAIRGAIDEVNDAIDDSGFHFECGKFEHSNETGRYGMLSIDLRGDAMERYVIHLNVSDVGNVRPVFVPSRPGSGPSDFEFFGRGADHYVDLLTQFFEIIIETIEKRHRSGRR
ncbi:cell envelope integrity protein TolA [Bradyrhizobium amphicarpaeae]|uniref:Uncharacterized protein n=1 Tax=Bradyrhizobium amphicarpaeae TaxID=1404768 RepID=A0A2U8PTZ7_9BRAD|nr:cell envelope integrity protein TolA [Bradyrhizobium amphicarpaeae]AWM01286.1 hypothetical protein CIT40_15425 [Bradyrhizobium amphicarpaeae]